jgi:hypothetical protein
MIGMAHRRRRLQPGNHLRSQPARHRRRLALPRSSGADRTIAPVALDQVNLPSQALLFSQVGPGLPLSHPAAGSGYASPPVVAHAVNRLPANCLRSVPPAGHSAVRGVMTSPINRDGDNRTANQWNYDDVPGGASGARDNDGAC